MRAIDGGNNERSNANEKVWKRVKKVKRTPKKCINNNKYNGTLEKEHIYGGGSVRAFSQKFIDFLLAYVCDTVNLLKYRKTRLMALLLAALFRPFSAFFPSSSSFFLSFSFSLLRIDSLLKRFFIEIVISDSGAFFVSALLAIRWITHMRLFIWHEKAHCTLCSHICASKVLAQRTSAHLPVYARIMRCGRKKESEIKTETWQQQWFNKFLQVYRRHARSQNDYIRKCSVNNQYSIWRSVEKQSHISLLNYFATILTLIVNLPNNYSINP